MYIEIYVDSLFLINFVMNFYLLLLLDRSTCRTATRTRMVLGAALGAVFSLLPFLGVQYRMIKVASGAVLGTGTMLFTAFRIKSIRAFFRVLEKLLFFSFLMGGGLFFLLRSAVLPTGITDGIFGVMALGGMIYLLVSHGLERKGGTGGCCRVILDSGERRVAVTALIDSGNSLTEPVSGKPVSVIDRSLFCCLWEKPPELFRIIPYHSVGKKRGMLKGYFLKSMEIEVEGATKICREVCVAVSEETLEGPGILVNPVLLKKREMRGRSDSKICNLPQNAVGNHRKRKIPLAEKRRHLLYRRSRDIASAIGTGPGESGHQ